MALAGSYDAILAGTEAPDVVGDQWLFSLLLRLGDPSLSEPVLDISGSRVEYRDTEVRLTPFGQRVIDGTANFVDANGIDDWVAGVHLQSDAGRVCGFMKMGNWYVGGFGREPMTTTDPRLSDCVLGGYSVVLTKPRPDWARAVLPDWIVSRSRCLVGELADVWLDAYREREGDLETVYGQAQERFGLERAASTSCVGGIRRGRSWSSTCLPRCLRPRRLFGASSLADWRWRLSGWVCRAPTLKSSSPGGHRRRKRVGSSSPSIPSWTSLSETSCSPQVEPCLDSSRWSPTAGSLARGSATAWIETPTKSSGFQTNAHGLIDSIEDAARVVRYIREDGHAEPGLWLPWLLVQYDAPS